MINVTKTFLPPLDEYITYLERIWASGWITNNGELVQELENKLADYLDVPYIQFVSNGTIALQLALRALNIQGEVITTPFSYVATTNTILWEHCKPIFVDIDKRTLCIDPNKIEAAVTDKTQAILAVHVYGYPCDVEAIQTIAAKYDLKVIYDGAHAFGCKYKKESLLNYGDISTLSFHATKLFHTVEGGAVIVHSKDMAEKIWLLKSFGHIGEKHFIVGINGKNSELHAAMGLCMLNHIDQIIKDRKNVFQFYDKFLNEMKPPVAKQIPGSDHNFSYYPILFESEARLLAAIQALNSREIYPRRYFYPPLNKMPFLSPTSMPVAEDISSRILCLPMQPDLSEEIVKMICDTILQSSSSKK
jgi:dTDP-4-amino-4,6-dideoxygalactose transaminase